MEDEREPQLPRTPSWDPAGEGLGVETPKGPEQKVGVLQDSFPSQSLSGGIGDTEVPTIQSPGGLGFGAPLCPSEQRPHLGSTGL